MATKITVNELIERNKAYALTHQPIPTLAELSELAVEPPHLAIITCMDPRCRPDIFLNLKPTEGVVTFRNICGHIAPILVEIASMEIFLGLTDILLIHHTDCGATHFKDEVIRAALKSRLPDEKSLDTLSFGAVDDIEQSIKDDLAILKASPLIRKELAERAVGYLYDIKTGELRKVDG